MSEHSKPLVVDLRKSANDCTLGNERLAKQTLYSLAADAIERLERELHAVTTNSGSTAHWTSLVAERDRLRAALENIIATESVDNDGEPVPETGACFLARRALQEPKP